MERETQEKRLEILGAAMKLFSERGFERTTVDEIAACANVGKGTIYLYFDNKEEVFLATIEEGLTAMHRMITEILAGPGDYLQRLCAVIRAHLQYVEQNHNFFKIFMKERLSSQLPGADQTRCRIKTAHLKLNQILEENLQTGISQGYFKPGDPHQYLLALNGIVNQFAFDWIMEGRSESLAELTEAILEIFLHGVHNTTHSHKIN